MSKKHKKVCRVLHYTDHSVILISTITGCVYILASAFLGFSGSLTGLKTCVITAGIKKYKSIIKKKKETT